MYIIPKFWEFGPKLAIEVILGFEILPKYGQNLWPNINFENKSQIYYGKLMAKRGKRLSIIEEKNHEKLLIDFGLCKITIVQDHSDKTDINYFVHGLRLPN